MTPTGIALKVTNKDGRESFPCYEAFGWDKVNQIIANTLEIEHVLKVEIVDVNVLRQDNSPRLAGTGSQSDGGTRQGVPTLQDLRQENKRMAKFFEIGWDKFGFYFETRLVDLYIDNRGLALGVALIVALRVRKVIKTRKAAK